MIAFLVFLALMVAFIVACVCISMRLGASHSVEYPSRHQIVSLHQEAFIEGRLDKQDQRRLDMGMGECVRRVIGLGLLVVGVVVVLVVLLIAIAL